ncbi:4Fe-4S dicluster domain-containing protein [Enemella sp. A6]|uniref:4Fe-4S dicluster domain-containing protein n=1 Tax=Enemella sp. A6 TaxID=3440152 RepID=UPI003EBB6D07
MTTEQTPAGTTRGGVVIDVDSCKGCELCITVCPPNVLEMSADRNALGYRYPVLHDGCTGCTACQMVCPDYVFTVYRRPRAKKGDSQAD